MKTLLEQRDKYNQRLTLHLLNPVNGRDVDLNKYVRDLVKTQSLPQWNGRQEEFKKWIADCIAAYLVRCDLRIYGYSN